MIGRQALAALLIIALAHPAWGNPEIVGTVGVSRAAAVRGIALLPGSTVFSGDAIRVGPDGNVRIALADGGAVYVDGDSQILLSKADNRLRFELVQGSAAFRFSGKASEARLADATIRPGGSGRASGVLVIRDAKSAMIAAQEGELVLTTSHDANAVTLHAGEGVELSLVPDEPQAPSPQPPKRRRKRALIIWFVSAAVVTAVALPRNPNDNSLNFQDKRTEVSPFRFP